MFIEILSLIVLCCIGIATRDIRRTGADSNKQLTSLQEEILRLRKVLEDKNVLATGVAHEIKNPLSAILFAVDNIRKEASTALESQHLKSLASIKEFGENILKLVSDFIDISRVDSGKLPVNPQKVGVMSSLYSACSLLNHEAQKKGVHFEMPDSQKDLFVNVDPKHLRQIFFNLLHNAVKFSHQNSRISLDVEQIDSMVRIVITDYGIGIPSQELERVFEPFALHAMNGTNEDGLGLGLSLCKALIEYANGRIEIDSTIDVGTNVGIYLPVYAEARKSQVNIEKQSEQEVGEIMH